MMISKKQTQIHKYMHVFIIIHTYMFTSIHTFDPDSVVSNVE